jgi:AraC-like DNA-binding protein
MTTRFSAAAPFEHAATLRCGRFEEVSPGDGLHKIVQVDAGRLELEGPLGVWSILPAHMVFIPAGRGHALRSEAVEAVVVHLDPARMAWRHDGCWATATSPLAREMIAYAQRWSSERDGGDEVAESFFRTIGHLCADWFGNSRILWLPTGRTREVRAAIRHVLEHPGSASVEEAAAVACLSPRTLRRRFQGESGMTWRQFVREARMTQAMDLLAAGEARISDVAYAVGFESLSTFTQAFTTFSGRSPSAFARAQAAGRRAGTQRQTR